MKSEWSKHAHIMEESLFDSLHFFVLWSYSKHCEVNTNRENEIHVEIHICIENNDNNNINKNTTTTITNNYNNNSNNNNNNNFSNERQIHEDSAFRQTCVPSEDQIKPRKSRIFTGISKDAKFLYADKKTDQTAWMRRLIWVFVGRKCQKVCFSRCRPYG